MSAGISGELHRQDCSSTITKPYLTVNATPSPRRRLINASVEMEYLFERLHFVIGVGFDVLEKRSHVPLPQLVYFECFHRTIRGLEILAHKIAHKQTVRAEKERV